MSTEKKKFDLTEWMRKDLWPVDAACRLIGGANPDLRDDTAMNESDPDKQLPWAKIYQNAEAALAAGKLTLLPKGAEYIIGAKGVDPAEFLAWAQSKGYDVAHLIAVLPAAKDAPKVSKGKAGRPKSINEKVNAVLEMIACFERAANIKFTPQKLCGSAANLLDACQRFEKSKGIKPLIFRTSQDTFNGWLKSAGYSFPTGRTPNIEKNYWTQLVVKVTV